MKTRKPKQLKLDYYQSKAERHSSVFAHVTLFLFMLIVGVLLSSWALADAPVTLNWTLPTHCTNDQPIGTGQCGALQRVQLQCSDTQGGPYTWLWGRDAADGTSDIRDYPDGEYYCTMRAKNEAGWSGASGEIHFTVTTAPPDPVTPNPPTIITIEVQPSN